MNNVFICKHDDDTFVNLTGEDKYPRSGDIIYSTWGLSDEAERKLKLWHHVVPEWHDGVPSSMRLDLREAKCADLVAYSRDSRLEDLRILLKHYMNEECERCEGEGVLFIDCPKCKQGPDAEEFCDMCDGEGGYMEECPDCDGTGNYPEDSEDLGSLNEYGLSFDYVIPDDAEGYFRYQLSWGGPSEEFRIYANKGSYEWYPYRIDFWYLDWFDGAKRTLTGEDHDLLVDIIQQFFGSDFLDHVYNEATEDYEGGV